MEDINNGTKDRYWTIEKIRPYIIEYLKNRFPRGIIKREFSKVDIMVLGSNIPVEIQRTRTTSTDTRKGVNISGFENDIRKQIEQNIKIYGCCWFFFDAKLLYHLQNNLSRNSSINLDWLYQFWKQEDIKIFIITIDGAIRELGDTDFEFIKKFSNTCRLNEDEEHRILEKNKPKIAYRALKKNGFTTEEINSLYDEFEKNNAGDSFITQLKMKGYREKELGDILHGLDQLYIVNEMLKCNMNKGSTIPYTSMLGIIEGNNGNINGRAQTRLRCIDKYDIIQYFPGYFEKKDLWDYWRTHVVDHKTFVATVRGEYDYMKDRKNLKSIDDAWEK